MTWRRGPCKRPSRKVPGCKPEDVQDVVLGCAMPEAEQGLNIARNAVFVAKFPNSVPGETINRFCASGLQAIVHAGLQIHAGLAGRGDRRRRRVDVDGADGRQQGEPQPGAHGALPGGVHRHGSHRRARRQSLRRVRAEQDEFAVRSHERALAALSRGPLQGRDLRRQGARARGRAREQRRLPASTSARAPARRWRCSASCRRSSSRAAASPRATARR